MFGLSYSEFVQGSALRTWNCVSHFASLLWYKFNHLRDPIMPKSRRRHHSRSRSRSHSHERDRDVKRRKIESYDSPHHRRSVSSEPEAISETNNDKNMDLSSEVISIDVSNEDETSVKALEISKKQKNEKQSNAKTKAANQNDEENINKSIKAEEKSDSKTDKALSTCEPDCDQNDEENTRKVTEENDETTEDTTEKEDDDIDDLTDSTEETNKQTNEDGTPSKLKDKSNDLKLTPKKVLSPKQLQKKLESEKKRQEKQKEKEEKERQRLDEQRKKIEEKKRITEEKLRQKQEKEEQRLKEKQAKEEKKKKEQEEKDKKRREKEEKEELKKKEREQEKLKKQQEIEEKNKEKQKLEEQKQKTAAAFANFFVSKRTEVEEKRSEELSTFMPFEIKSDMRLAPLRRREIIDNEKTQLDYLLTHPDSDKSYLRELKDGKEIGKSEKTWKFEDADQDDDVIIIDENIGERIVEQKPKFEKMRAKFFKFHENQRPPYFGTFKKKSKNVTQRKPFAKDSIFNYEVDSDEEWEEEGEGESLKGTDDEDEKDNESENEYEVDNEVFVPHAYLSDDECDEEVNSKLSPESHKAKLKLLKNEFDEEMKSKTKKIKPRVIGCIWYDKNKNNIEEAIDRCLQPFSIICNGQIQIKKRSEFESNTLKKVTKLLSKEHIPLFLEHIHGSIHKRKNIVKTFLEYMSNNGTQIEVSQMNLGKQLRNLAQWQKCPEEGAMHNKMCWYVNEDVRKEYNVDLSLPNKISAKSVPTK